MDKEAVVAMQNFCNLFDRQKSEPDRLVITNVPYVVDFHYESDPIRSEIVKPSLVRPLKTRVIHFSELVDEPSSDSLYEVSVSTEGCSLDQKLKFPSPSEFSEEEMSGDSVLKARV